MLHTDNHLKAFVSQPKAPTPLKSKKMFSIDEETAVNKLNILLLISFNVHLKVGTHCNVTAYQNTVYRDSVDRTCDHLTYQKSVMR
jgi:hypothetical protein